MGAASCSCADVTCTGPSSCACLEEVTFFHQEHLIELDTVLAHTTGTGCGLEGGVAGVQTYATLLHEEAVAYASGGKQLLVTSPVANDVVANQFEEEEVCEKQPPLPMLLRTGRATTPSRATGGGSPRKPKDGGRSNADAVSRCPSGLRRHRVVVRRESLEEDLGLDVRSAGHKFLQVAHIDPAGAAARPDDGTFKLGDYIQRVNGVGGARDRLVQECALRAELTFEVVRPEEQSIDERSLARLLGGPAVPPLRLPENPGSPRRRRRFATQ